MEFTINYMKENNLGSYISGTDTFTFPYGAKRANVMRYAFENALHYDLLDSYKEIEVHHEENDEEWGTLFGVIDKYGYSFEDETGNWIEVKR